MQAPSSLETAVPEIVIPARFDEIVAEIARFTGLPRDDVETRVWLEAVQGGWNVSRDAARFGVTPHHYDERLARLYEESDGFIFETLVYWARPARQRWIAQACERLAAHARRHAVAPRDLRILMLGDGAGNDSLYLVRHGHRVEYFDSPGSRTFEFARRRFAAAGLLGGDVSLIAAQGAIAAGRYDAAVSFELLEHLPDPRGAIRDLARFLKPGGIALVTVAFDNLRENVPTHLAANGKLDGRTPFLFWTQGLALSWYSVAPLFKPFEFTKTGRRGVRALVDLVTDAHVLRAFLLGRCRNAARRARALARRVLPSRA